MVFQGRTLTSAVEAAVATGDSCVFVCRYFISSGAFSLRLQPVELCLQITAAEIGGVGKTVAPQQAGGEIAALAFLAVDHNAAVGR
jgi:hypothetical protein